MFQPFFLLDGRAVSVGSISLFSCPAPPLGRVVLGAVAQFFLMGLVFLSVSVALVLAAVFDLSAPFFSRMAGFELLACGFGAGGVLSFLTFAF